MKKGIEFYEHKDGEFRVRSTKRKNEISRRRMRAELKREGVL